MSDVEGKARERRGRAGIDHKGGADGSGSEERQKRTRRVTYGKSTRFGYDGDVRMEGGDVDVEYDEGRGVLAAFDC